MYGQWSAASRLHKDPFCACNEFIGGQNFLVGYFINLAIESTPDYGRLHEVRGAQSYADGKTEEAIKFFETALQRNSGPFETNERPARKPSHHFS